MKRIISAVLAGLILCMLFCGCSNENSSRNIKNNGQKYNIAVISAGACDEEFNGFFSGVYDTFRNIGYSVDKFAAANDEQYLESVLADSLKGGYIGVVLYDLNDYADEFIEEAKKAGVFVCVFSKDAYQSDRAPTVCYNQEQLTKTAIDELLKMYREDISYPKTVIKAWYDETDSVKMSRSYLFDTYASQNGLPVNGYLYEEKLNDKSGLSRTAKNQLLALPQTGTNYIWAVDDTMAALIAEYLKDESINNAVVVNIGMNQKNIHKMFEYETYWSAASVVSYKTSGSVCADVLSKSIESKQVQPVTYIPAFMLYSEELEENPSIEILEEKANEQI